MLSKAKHLFVPSMESRDSSHSLRMTWRTKDKGPNTKYKGTKYKGQRTKYKGPNTKYKGQAFNFQLSIFN